MRTANGRYDRRPLASSAERRLSGALRDGLRRPGLWRVRERADGTLDTLPGRSYCAPWVTVGPCRTAGEAIMAYRAGEVPA